MKGNLMFNKKSKDDETLLFAVSDAKLNDLNGCIETLSLIFSDLDLIPTTKQTFFIHKESLIHFRIKDLLNQIRTKKLSQITFVEADNLNTPFDLWMCQTCNMRVQRKDRLFHAVSVHEKNQYYTINSHTQ